MYDFKLILKSNYQQPRLTSFRIFDGRRGSAGREMAKTSTAGMLRLYAATRFVVAAQFPVN
jgi:hypothetical protein